MARIKKSPLGFTPFQQLFYSQKVLDKWSSLSEALSEDGLLSYELKEQVRRVLAFGNGCKYCQSKGKPESSENMKTSYAVAFAEVFLMQREKVEEKFFHVLKEIFTDEEISGLIAFICFTTAQQYFGALMDLKPENKEE
ncbi:carboxymuconolactone decarboxylase family protein [Bacillus sp. V59.32b]|uniref:carboxymuconolactone decarboxylase family protein n=1 Tax=Bacillus sp. V59.32b TaxID=1758642 RepID=UPI000E3CD8E1|nr:carboxymuconolactone decarboxylase family protein [Bacillus sp. V59.32b]RFU64028.1 carboxymuconolactone decarboxylase family protein [Bacillus sp. V59.32b]